jgi:adenine-specific DNA-methyltransferase
MTLFEEYKYFDYIFPEPQYLGAKYKLLGWIKQFIPDDIKTAFDAFGGSQSVAFLFKQMGFTTITNDFLNCNNQIGKSLIENSKEKLSSEDINILFGGNSNPQKFNLMRELYTGLFFVEEDAEFIDSFRSNIDKLDNIYKQALALTVMNRSMTRKVTMGHFAHTQALVYANNPDRIKRNRSLIRPIKDLFLELLPQYNQAVFDNGCSNLSYNEDTINLLPKLKNVDLIYFDPPYCGSHPDYQSFYHLLETYTEYWKDKSFVNGTKRYEPQRHSGFDKKCEVIKSFEQLFEAAKDIPYWIISYNDRSYPTMNDFIKLISCYRDVEVVEHTYDNNYGGKGSVKGSKELLFICKSKKTNLNVHNSMLEYDTKCLRY